MRSLALAQCVLLTLSMVGSHAHRALVRHEYCTDHGALVHASEEAHSRKPAPPSRDAVTSATHLEGAHGCAILEFLTQTTTAGSSCCTTPSRWRGGSCPTRSWAAASRSASRV